MLFQLQLTGWTRKPLPWTQGSSKMVEMSRESFYQPHPPEVPQAHPEKFVAPPISLCMAQTVTQLANAYGVDLSQKGANFHLQLPNQPQCWLIGNIDSTRIGVTRCQVDAENCLAPDLDVVFEVTPVGWEPRELTHSDQVWQAYLQAMQALGEAVVNAQGDFNFTTFTDFVAQALAQLTTNTQV